MHRRHTTMIIDSRLTPVISIRKVEHHRSTITISLPFDLVLTLLRTNENSWPFLVPVTEEFAPNYFSIVNVIPMVFFLFTSIRMIMFHLESDRFVNHTR
jgi:hypothetical protein